MHCFLIFKSIHFLFNCNNFVLIFMKSFILFYIFDIIICSLFIYSFFLFFISSENKLFLIKFWFSFKRPHLYLGPLLLRYQLNVQDYCYLKKIFYEDKQNGFFFHHDSLDSPTQVYSSLSETSDHSIPDLPQLVFSLFIFLFFGIFCLISVSLVVVASDLIFQYINHHQ